MTVTVLGRTSGVACGSGFWAKAVPVVNNARRTRRAGLNFILRIFPLHELSRLRRLTGNAKIPL